MTRCIVALSFLLATASAWAQSPDLESARRHFEAGSQAFQKGDYPKAELEFRAAYAITKDPLLFYNIAQSQQRRGHLEQAVKSYRAYLAGVPDAEDRKEVEGFIAEIEKQITAPRATPTPKVTPTPGPVLPPAGPVDDNHRARRQSAWIVGGVSVAALGLGIIFSVKSKLKADDANTMIDYRIPPEGYPLTYVSQRGWFDTDKDLAQKWGAVAISMYCVAAVGAGVATYLFLTSRTSPASRERREARVRLIPVLDPHNAGVVAGVEF
jgi:tetratricopeptide (TPR) repeat protein